MEDGLLFYQRVYDRFVTRLLVENGGWFTHVRVTVPH